MTLVEDISDPSTPDSRYLFQGSFSKINEEGVAGRRIIAGYANVSDVVDNQNEKVTNDALHRAWGRWSANPDYCMIMLMHSSTPVAKVLFDPVTDSRGNTHRSGVDDRGLYLVAEWRDDTVAANKAWGKVESGEMRGFSIGGIRLSNRRDCVGSRCFNVLEDMEIYETSVVSKPANEWSVFGMLKEDLLELSKVSNMFKEAIIAKDMIRISKTRGCSCGKYHILLDESLKGLRDKFETPNTRVIEKAVEGMEYVPLFDLALLRPFSIDEETVMTAESDSGGFESSPKKDEPIREGDIMNREVNKEQKEVDEESTTEPHEDKVEPVVEPEVVPEVKVEEPQVPDSNEALLARIGQLEEKLKQFEEAKVVTPEPAPVVEVETPIVPVKGSEGSNGSVEVTPTPSPEPVVEQPKPETRGKVPPPAESSEGFNLLDMHHLSWKEIEDLRP